MSKLGALRWGVPALAALGTLYAWQIPFREFNGVEYRVGDIRHPVGEIGHEPVQVLAVCAGQRLFSSPPNGFQPVV